MTTPREKPAAGGAPAKPAGDGGKGLAIDTSRLRLKDGEKITLGPSGLSLDTRGLTSSASGVSIGASRISFTSSGLSLASWQSLVKAPSGAGASTTEPSRAQAPAAAKLTQSRPGRGRSSATKAESKRQIIQQSPMLIISRETNLEAHNDPSRRGGYLLVAPGQVPEIVLDGLSSDAEQFDAEQRCRRELALSRRAQEEFDESREGAPVEPTTGPVKRRELVRLTDSLVVSRDFSKEAHADPDRRGAYVLLQPRRRPEIVLDGLAGRAEQQAALERCVHFVELTQTGSGALQKLTDLLKSRERPVYSGGAPLPAAQEGHQYLGARLLHQGLITTTDLEQALDEQGQLPAGTSVRRVGSLLVEAKKLSLIQLARVLAELRGARPMTSPVTRVDPHLRGLLPLPLLIELEAAPLFLTGRTLGVALCDPHDERRVAVLQSHTELQVQPLQAPQVQVHKLLLSLTPKR